MRWVKRILVAIAAVTVVLAVAVGVNTLRQSSRQIAVQPVAMPALDATAAAARLGSAVTFKTISLAQGLPPAAEEFLKLHAHLAASFPKVHATLEREVVNGLSLLYTWRGSNPNARALILMAHQDVVPIAPGSEPQWTHPPFEGRVADGFIWGRGAWDDKGNLMAMMEAVELLASAGFQPRQTVYLAFGHDEEIGGLQGAKAIGDVLRGRGVRAEMAIDEGLIVTEGIIDGIASPVALIGIAEKGIVTLELKARGVPGHSSMPPSTTAIGTLARALARLEAEQFPARLTGVAAETYRALAPEFGGARRVLLSNLWLTSPIVIRLLAASPSTNASLRTTTALTVLRAGEKDNVLPASAEAQVNFRILPGETMASVTERVKGIVGPSVDVTLARVGTNPSAVSSIGSRAFVAVARSIREVFPGVVVAPGLMTAATDTRHMTGVADDVYRFSPFRAGSKDLTRFHGNDERISVANYAEAITFFHRLLTNLSQDELKTAGSAK
jgi:carboxypeptidase PM20D1